MGDLTQAAAKQLAWDVDSRKSVEVRVRNEIMQRGPGITGDAAFLTYTEHYIEKATGERFYEFLAVKDGKGVMRSEHFGNGAKYADVDYVPGKTETQAAVNIGRQFWMEGRNDRKQLPHPLLYLYVGRTPLHQALPKARYLGQEDVMGRACQKFLFTNVAWPVPQDQIFFLDKATATPLKVEGFRDQAARDKNEPMWSWTAESLEDVQGRFVPMKATQITYAGDGTPMLTTKQEVESIEFNKEYPAGQFWMTPQPGTVVVDEFTKKVATVPGGVKEAVAGGTAATSIEAVPPGDWTGVVSNASIVLGAAVLIAAGLLWWRRH